MPKVLMSLLLAAVFVSCNAGAPGQRDKLTAQKEHLINKLSDNAPEVVSLLIKTCAPKMSGKIGAAKLKNLVRGALMASCDALESQDATTIAKELAQLVSTNGNKFSVQQDQLLPFIQQCIDAREISRENFCELPGREIVDNMLKQLGEEEIARLDIVLGDITALLKVVKQLRERT